MLLAKIERHSNLTWPRLKPITKYSRNVQASIKGIWNVKKEPDKTTMVVEREYVKINI